MNCQAIQTNRAKLDNPDKPIGVFMLAGPSGSARRNGRWPWPKSSMVANRT